MKLNSPTASNRRRTGYGWIMLLVEILAVTCSAHVRAEEAVSESMDALERKLEMGRHEQFVALRSRADSELKEFTTDGCSGGLSVGWEYLASRIEKFHEWLGERPSWGTCCTTHDEAYYVGGGGAADAESSFDARKKADLALEACVIETGKLDGPKLGERYGLSERDVKIIYATIAGLMYRAVRVGGMPCTGLPWRWGYGWPSCD